MHYDETTGTLLSFLTPQNLEGRRNVEESISGLLVVSYITKRERIIKGSL